MQVKKFEAPTIQEAIDTIKRELGPEAIILQTKKNKRGFGLMSKSSVEITAAVSERSIQKKQYVESRLPDTSKTAVGAMPAVKQAEFYEKYNDRQETKAATNKKITATRYADILDDEPPAQPSRPPRGQPQPALQARAQAAPPVQAQASAQSGQSGHSGHSGMMPKMSLEEEVRHLKRMVEDLKTTQDKDGSTGGATALSPQSPAMQDAFEQLVINGIDKRYAFSIVKKASFELGEDRALNPEFVQDQLANEIMQTTEVLSPFAGITPGSSMNGPAVFALVGSTGVGKTTTVAKLASEALLKRNLKVGLINLDSYKIAAFDQLATYAKILNVPFRSAGSSEDLKAAMQDFQGLDVVLIDTTGRSQRDPAALKEMQTLLQAIPQAKTHLVLSATTRDTELYDTANRFSIFRPQGAILSKLDEATIYGAVYNVCQKAKLPLLYFTTGQRVPEDIEEATRERVASLILDI